MTRTTNRLYLVEASRSGLDVVLAWLDEAQAYPSQNAYARASLDRTPGERPLARIRREIRAGAAGTELTR